MEWLLACTASYSLSLSPTSSNTTTISITYRVANLLRNDENKSTQCKYNPHAFHRNYELMLNHMIDAQFFVLPQIKWKCCHIRSYILKESSNFLRLYWSEHIRGKTDRANCLNFSEWNRDNKSDKIKNDCSKMLIVSSMKSFANSYKRNSCFHLLHFYIENYSRCCVFCWVCVDHFCVTYNCHLDNIIC